MLDLLRGVEVVESEFGFGVRVEIVPVLGGSIAERHFIKLLNWLSEARRTGREFAPDGEGDACERFG